MMTVGIYYFSLTRPVVITDVVVFHEHAYYYQKCCYYNNQPCLRIGRIVSIYMCLSWGYAAVFMIDLHNRLCNGFNHGKKQGTATHLLCPYLNWKFNMLLRLSVAIMAGFGALLGFFVVFNMTIVCLHIVLSMLIISILYAPEFDINQRISMCLS